MSNTMTSAMLGMERGLKRQAREIARDEASHADTLPVHRATVDSQSRTWALHPDAGPARRLNKKTTIGSLVSIGSTECDIGTIHTGSNPTRRLFRKTKMICSRERISVKSAVFHPSYNVAPVPYTRLLR